MVYVESDALGGYLIDRLRSQLAKAAENPGTPVVLGYTSSQINEYFTAAEVGVSPSRPTTGVPREVVDALRKCIDAPGWIEVTDAVMLTEAGTWRKWRQFARRHRRSGTFTLTPQIDLVVGRAASHWAKLGPRFGCRSRLAARERVPSTLTMLHRRPLIASTPLSGHFGSRLESGDPAPASDRLGCHMRENGPLSPKGIPFAAGTRVDVFLGAYRLSFCSPHRPGLPQGEWPRMESMGLPPLGRARRNLTHAALLSRSLSTKVRSGLEVLTR